MTIDEAIERYKENAKRYKILADSDELVQKSYCTEFDKFKYAKSAEEHEQLAEWLEELKDYRDKNKMVVRIDCINSEEFNDFAVKLAKEQYNKAIDDLICKIEEHKTKGYVTGITYNPFEFGACQMADDIIKIAEQLKAGGRE